MNPNLLSMLYVNQDQSHEKMQKQFLVRGRRKHIEFSTGLLSRINLFRSKLERKRYISYQNKNRKCTFNVSWRCIFHLLIDFKKWNRQAKVTCHFFNVITPRFKDFSMVVLQAQFIKFTFTRLSPHTAIKKIRHNKKLLTNTKN